MSKHDVIEVETLAGNLSLINQDLIVQIFFFFHFFLYIESICPYPSKKKEQIFICPFGATIQH